MAERFLSPARRRRLAHTAVARVALPPGGFDVDRHAAVAPRARLTGWAWPFGDERIERVEVLADGAPAGTARLTLRPDIAEALDRPEAMLCGFDAVVALPRTARMLTARVHGGAGSVAETPAHPVVVAEAAEPAAPVLAAAGAAAAALAAAPEPERGRAPSGRRHRSSGRPRRCASARPAGRGAARTASGCGGGSASTPGTSSSSSPTRRGRRAGGRGARRARRAPARARARRADRARRPGPARPAAARGRGVRARGPRDAPGRRGARRAVARARRRRARARRARRSRGAHRGAGPGVRRRRAASPRRHVRAERADQPVVALQRPADAADLQRPAVARVRAPELLDGGQLRGERPDVPSEPGRLVGLLQPPAVVAAPRERGPGADGRVQDGDRLRTGRARRRRR